MPERMPPIRMTGVSSGRKPSRNASQVARMSKGAPRQATPPGDDRDPQHQRRAHEQARDQPGNQDAAHRDVGHQGIDDQRHAGRDDRPDGRGRGDDGDRKILLVALVLHRLDDDGAQPRRLGHGRARHAGEDDAGDDVDLRQAAPHRADQRFGESVDTVRDAADIHHLAGVDEERHRQQHEIVDPRNRLLHHEGSVEGKAALERGDDDRRSGQAEGYGDGRHEQPEQDEDIGADHQRRACRRPMLRSSGLTE
jgi:hypothetical protein